MGQLAPSERKVARALLSAYPIAGLESLTQLAARAHVTGPTVMRFVRKLAFGGYPDFQRALREEVQARMTSPLSLYRTQVPGSKKGVLESSAEILTRNVERTLRAIPPSEFQTVVDGMADLRRRIICTGGRFSQMVAHFLYAHVKMLRPGVVLVGGTSDQRMDELLDVGRRDLLCVFDYRRYQEDTIVFARQAAARGASVVLFTDPWLSPIAEVADAVLISSSDSPSPFDSMSAAFSIIEALVAGLVLALGRRGRSRVEELEAVRAAAAGAEGPRPGAQTRVVARRGNSGAPRKGGRGGGSGTRRRED